MFDHVKFGVSDYEKSKTFFLEALRPLRTGAQDNGAPGLRSYGKNYYAAFVIAPDGHNIEAVCHAPESDLLD
jgi:catechol 2,3-dioxygenase-like lactoylglutathione lyase family enzyme